MRETEKAERERERVVGEVLVKGYKVSNSRKTVQESYCAIR